MLFVIYSQKTFFETNSTVIQSHIVHKLNNIILSSTIGMCIVK